MMIYNKIKIIIIWKKVKNRIKKIYRMIKKVLQKLLLDKIKINNFHSGN